VATADTTARPLPGRGLPPVSQLVLWFFGALLVIATFGWLLKELIESPSRFIEVTLIGLTNGSIYALVALGYTLVYGIIELINFAHGDNFMIGSFETHSMVTEGAFQLPLYPTTFVLGIPLGTTAIAADSGLHRAYAIALALFFSMLLCMTINVTIERIGYKPLRNQPRLAPLITAIGFSFLLQNIALIWKNASPQPVPDIFPKGNVIATHGVSYEWGAFIVIVITIPLLLVLSWLVRSTKAGKAMRATAQDQDASAMMGINVDRTISFTFALGGALAGAAGAIYALSIGNTKFDLGFRLGLFAFTAAVLGGIGNLTGAVVGGVLLGLVAAYNDGDLLFNIGARWTNTVIFSILILILVFKPSGLLGEQTPEGQ
jgi:branched-chain amino acid transport system permease protein